ncbi:hypothetical protein GEMRC1_010823 [Eukaryota sp. GEM-RC1]
MFLYLSVLLHVVCVLSYNRAPDSEFEFVWYTEYVPLPDTMYEVYVLDTSMLSNSSKLNNVEWGANLREHVQLIAITNSSSLETVHMAQLKPDLKWSRDSLREEGKLRLLCFSNTSIDGVLQELRTTFSSDVLTIEETTSNSIVVSSFFNLKQIAELISYIDLVIRIELVQEYSVNDISTSSFLQHQLPELCSFSPDSSIVSKPSGLGQIVTLIDTGIVPTHCNFADTTEVPTGVLQDADVSLPSHRKILFIDDHLGSGQDTNGHGTLMASIIAGSSTSTSSPSCPGISTKAKLLVIDLGQDDSGTLNMPLDVYSRLLQPSYSLGSRVFSNSYGSSFSGSPYTYDSSEWDRFVNNHRDAVVVFAAGNSGQKSSITSPATAKNVITVGSTFNSHRIMNDMCQSGSSCSFLRKELFDDHIVTNFSSKGPLDYGSFGIDVVTTGVGVLSADGQTDCGFVPASGTSVSAAVVSGAVVQIRDHFNQLSNQSIMSSTVRSVVHGGAISDGRFAKGNRFTRITSRDQSIQGYGRLSLSRLNQTVILSNEDHLLNSSGDFVSFCLEVTDSSRDLIVSMAWTDLEGFPGCQSCIVNSLELSVTDPNGDTLVGNSDSRVSSTSARLIISNPELGKYRIIVRSLDISTEQSFGLSVINHDHVIDCPDDDICPYNCKSNEVCSYSVSSSCELCPLQCFNNGKCLESGVCQCYSPFFGVDCSKSLLPRVTNVEVSSTPTIFKLADGNFNYPPNSINRINVLNPSDQEYQLVIRDLNLGCGDFLQVLQLDRHGQSFLIEELTGTDHNDIIYTLNSDSFLLFESDQSSEAQGFEVIIHDLSTPTPKDPCTWWTEVTEGSQSMEVFGSDELCTFAFEIESEFVLELNISNFEISANDLIEVWWYWQSMEFLLANVSMETARDYTFYVRHPVRVKFSGSFSSHFDLSWSYYRRGDCPDHVPSYYCRPPSTLMMAEKATITNSFNRVDLIFSDDIRPVEIENLSFNCKRLMELDHANCTIKNDRISISSSDLFLPGQIVKLIENDLIDFQSSSVTVTLFGLGLVPSLVVGFLLCSMVIGLIILIVILLMKKYRSGQWM